MRSVIARCLLAFGLALVASSGFGAEAAPPGATLVRVTMRDGRVIWGELQSQHGRQDTILGLTDNKEQRLAKGQVVSMDRSVTVDQAAQECGVDAVVAWKTRAIAKATMTSTPMGKIARITDGVIYIAGGHAAVDDRLQISQTTPILDPDSKKVLGTDTKVLAELEVTDVDSGFIKAKVVSRDRHGAKLEVGQQIQTDPEALPLVMVAGDSGAAGEADKQVLDQISAKLSAGDLPVVDAAQTIAAIKAIAVSPAQILEPATAQKLGQKLGASTVIVARAPAADASTGVQIQVINVASGAVALSVTGPPSSSTKNASVLTLDVSLHVDGKDELDIGPDSLEIKHIESSPPERIKINGIEPKPGERISDSGSTMYLSPKADLSTARIVNQSGRGRISLDRATSDGVVVTFSDPDPGAGDYSVTLQFQEKGSTVARANPPGPDHHRPTPVATPADQGAPVADLFSLAGQAGLPQYLIGDDSLWANSHGVTGGRAHTARGDLGDKDFVLDVVFEFPPGDRRDEATVGLGDPDHGLSVRLRPPSNGGTASMRRDNRTDNKTWAKYHTPGPHLLRLEKSGDQLTCSITYNFDGKYRPDAVHKVDSVKATFSDMNRLNCPLFIDGGAVFEAIRLQVDGQTLSPGTGPPPIAEPPADAGWTTFVPGAGLPPGMSGNPYANIAADGMCFPSDKYLFSAARNFIDKDFTLDVVYHFDPNNNRSLIVGMGDAGDNQHRVQAELASPVRDGVVTLVTGPRRRDLISLHKDHTGPNMVRIQKRGDTLLVALCVDYKGAFSPDVTQVIPSLKAMAPFLTAASSPVYFGGGARIDKARLLIVGEPIPQVAAIAPGSKNVANLIKLTGQELPSFLKGQRDLDFSHGGLKLLGKQIFSRRDDLIGSDFVADVLIMPPDDWHTMRIGYGADDQSANANWVDKSAYISVTAPRGVGGAVELGLTHDSQNMGHYTGPGPHLLRVEKRGNTLTFSFCNNYHGTFQPDFVRSIPDLKAVVPDVNSHNSYFFMAGGGIVQQMAFSVNGVATDSADVALNIPPSVVEGHPVRVQIAARGAGSMFSLGDAAPQGVSVSPSGQLTWTPTHAQVGTHEFQIKIAQAGKLIAETVHITVVSTGDAVALHGDLGQLDTLYRLPVTQKKHLVTPGLDNSLLLLDGDTLRRLGSDGFTVKQTMHLPKSYRWIGERETYFVALSEQAKCLDFIDKDSLKVRRSLQMKYFGLHDLCLVPKRDISYVMVEKSTGDGLEPQILVVNETTGDVHEPDDFGGTWAKASADGTKLFVGYKDIYQKGDRLLFNPDHIDVVPEYGNIDILMVYDITRPTAPVLISAKNDAGANGFGIAVSADGTKVSYLSFVGYPLFSKDIAAWDPTDLTKRPVSYPTKDNKGDCRYLAFHPILPIAAAPAQTGAICFDQNTGELQKDRLDFGPALGEVKVTGLIFSPDGKNLILDCSDDAKFFLRKVKLNLSAEELKQIQRGPVTPIEVRPHTGNGPRASAGGAPNSPSGQYALQSP